jgi:hypothetical protein
VCGLAVAVSVDLQAFARAMTLPLQLGTHGWHHGEFFLYVLVALLILYKPPRLLTDNLAGLRNFFESHYGDSIGYSILLLAIVLIILGDVWPQLTHAAIAGQGLLVAATAMLKLKPNGNGNGPASAPVPNTPTTPVAAPSPAVPAAAPIADVGKIPGWPGATGGG